MIWVKIDLYLHRQCYNIVDPKWHRACQPLSDRAPRLFASRSIVGSSEVCQCDQRPPGE